MGEKYYFLFEYSGMKTARGRKTCRLLYKRLKPERIELQLGRVVACQILGQKEKVNWKNCQLEREEEDQMVQRFEKAFAAFLK